MLNKGRYTKKADVFSLGVVFFRLATGKFPFDESELHSKDQPDPKKLGKILKQVVSLLSSNANAYQLVKSMISWSRNDRPNADQVLDKAIALENEFW